MLKTLLNTDPDIAKSAQLWYNIIRNIKKTHDGDITGKALYNEF